MCLTHTHTHTHKHTHTHTYAHTHTHTHTRTHLHVAYTVVSYWTVLQEIRKGADVTKADNKGRTALHFAATRGDSNMGIIIIIIIIITMYSSTKPALWL